MLIPRIFSSLRVSSFESISSILIPLPLKTILLQNISLSECLLVKYLLPPDIFLFKIFSLPYQFCFSFRIFSLRYYFFPHYYFPSPGIIFILPKTFLFPSASFINIFFLPINFHSQYFLLPLNFFLQENVSFQNILLLPSIIL